MAGRTSWWAHDAAWHRRDAFVEMLDECGPATFAVMCVLWSWAQEQGATGEVRGGYRTLARETGVTQSDAAQLVTSASGLGLVLNLDEFDDGKRFSLTVRWFASDRNRGKAAIRQQNHRSTKTGEDDVTDSDVASQSVTHRDELRPVTPSTQEEKREEERRELSAAQRAGGPSEKFLSIFAAEKPAIERKLAGKPDDIKASVYAYLDREAPRWHKDTLLPAVDAAIGFAKREVADRQAKQRASVGRNVDPERSAAIMAGFDAAVAAAEVRDAAAERGFRGRGAA